MENYSLIESIKQCERRIFHNKPDCIKNIRIIAYFKENGFDKKENWYVLLSNVDVIIEKEAAYHRVAWISNADYYNEDRSKEKAKRILIYELTDIIKFILEWEVDDFWIDTIWDTDWETLPYSPPSKAKIIYYNIN